MESTWRVENLFRDSGSMQFELVNHPSIRKGVCGRVVDVFGESRRKREGIGGFHDGNDRSEITQSPAKELVCHDLVSLLIGVSKAEVAEKNSIQKVPVLGALPTYGKETYLN